MSHRQQNLAILLGMARPELAAHGSGQEQRMVEAKDRCGSIDTHMSLAGVFENRSVWQASRH